MCCYALIVPFIAVLASWKNIIKTVDPEINVEEERKRQKKQQQYC